MLLLADKITNLTAARYFAARGASWLFFDQALISVPQIHAIREWVEGPEVGLYLPLGIQESDNDLLDQLAPDGIMIGHFGEAFKLPQGVTVIKEWRLEPGDDQLAIAGWIADWPQANHHLIRCEGQSIQDMKTMLSGLSEHLLSKLILSIDPASIDIMSGIGGLCLIAPNEEAIGLLSFDAIDEAIDQVENLIEF